MKLSVTQGYTGVLDAIQDETGKLIATLSHSMPEYERIEMAKALADAFNAVHTTKGVR